MCVYRMCTNKNKISLLFPLCTNNSEPGHFFLLKLARSIITFPGSGQLDLLDFLCSANQSVA